MIVVIVRTPRLHNFANVFVTSLALTDAIVGLATLIGGTAFVVVEPSDWMFEKIQAAFTVCYMGTTFGSFLHVAVIAIERYAYIVHPFWYYRWINKQLVTIILASTWILVAVYTLIISIILQNSFVCLFDAFTHLDIFYVDSCISLLLLSLTLMAYFRIAVLSLKHRRSVTAVNVAVLSASNVTQRAGIRTNLQENSWRDVRKTLSFYLVMTGSLAAFTFPLTVFALLARFSSKMDTNVLTLFMFLPILQSGFNFFIFIFMSSDFKQVVHNLFLGCFVN
ncbi:unnamed protein product [Candidula unifasciata]|uniref:G-protein coupled receptors family 1 profile domain-containing protein n=1 Tax=Candidula unifasciata TaxID=100452 RepID=A0A8S4ABC8_9EUPU|nr:unnamed protein product [Candidula unifasciata]